MRTAAAAAALAFGLMPAGAAQASVSQASQPPAVSVTPASDSAGAVAGPASFEPADCAAPPASGTPGDAAAGAAVSAYAQCFALVRTDAEHRVVASHSAPVAGALDPADIQAAYHLRTSAGAGKTIAIVDAYGYGDAEADLAKFRSYYGLPACTTDNGCFTKIDEHGGTDYPADDAGWALEQALDLDAVSSVCPNCDITLVEAATSSLTDLGTAEDTAAALPGVVAVSNSYGVTGQSPGVQGVEADYDHPGVAIAAATGDTGNAVSFPASSDDVMAVGGTTLTRAPSTRRGWAETAWDSGGSGCASYEPQPAFQQGIDTGCPDNRAIADISADADPATGIAVYDSEGYGWIQVGGTSLATPLISGMFGLAATPAAGTYPVSYPYQDPAQSKDLNDITEGTNGSCGTVLCQAGPGWDGPTGLGTPYGVGALESGPTGHLSGTVSAGHGNAQGGSGRPLPGATVAATNTSTGQVTEAVADSSGHYQMTVAAGSYDLTASLFGYASASAAGVAVGDEGSARQSFKLTAVPSYTVSGQVTDTALYGAHGYPLYARITVSGYPQASVYTNPYTGRYSVSLPKGRTYTLTATPVEMSGYTPATATVSVEHGAVTQDFAVAVDQATCTAPGYAWQYNTAVSTGFEGWQGTTAQDGWTNTGGGPSGIPWDFDDRSGLVNITGGTGQMAETGGIDSGASVDAALTSPVMDMSTQSDPQVFFDTAFNSYNPQSGTVELSLDGGQTWQTVWSQPANAFEYFQTEDVPIPQAAGQPDVQIRFHYVTTSGGLYWMIDDVRVGSQQCLGTPGGLVEGVVSDGNTGLPVDGATVTASTDAAATGITGPTADPALPNGYYWLFSPAGDATSLTASDGKYTPAATTAAVTADAVTRQDFTLTAGRLRLSSSGVHVTVPAGATRTRTLRFSNTGTQPVTVQLSQQDGTFAPAQSSGTRSGPAAQSASPAAVPVQRVKTHLSAGSLVSRVPPSAAASAAAPAAAASPADTPWTNLASYPDVIMDNAGGYYDGKVYSFGGLNGSDVPVGEGFVYDVSTGSWSTAAPIPVALERPTGAFLDGKFYMVGGWADDGNPVASTYIYDPATNRWTQGADMPQALTAPGVAAFDGELWVIGGCTTSGCVPVSSAVYSYDPATNTWTQHSDYPEPMSWLACGEAGGQLACAGGADANLNASADTYIYDPATDSWLTGPAMPYGDEAMLYSTADGSLVIQGGAVGGQVTNQAVAFDGTSWTALPNGNDAVYRGAGACGFYSVGGSTISFTPSDLVEQLPGYDAECSGTSAVPWLSESTSQFQVAPGESVTVRITIDAAQATAPGTYTATLNVDTSSPYLVTPVAISMRVTPGKSGSGSRG